MKILDLLEKIKPAVKGKSDKYSWFLYNWIKKNKFLDLTVWFDTRSILDGKETNFDKKNIHIGQIWIGSAESGWFHGSRLGSILGGKYQTWANPWMKNTHIDITEWFWEEYLKDGRCIWDRNHDRWIADDENRYIYINNNSRKCRWCGEWQYREIKKEIKIKRSEVWKREI